MDFADREQVKCRNNGDTDVCLSLDQVVAGPGVDLNETAVESEHQRSLLKDLMERNVGVFYQHPLDYGHTKTVQHEFPLVDSKPFRLPYRKIPPSQWQDVRKLLIEMEATGVIRPSKSPYASPVVVVTKKDGSLRLCIDYRKLNSCSTRDAFPLPRIEEALEALGQAKFFSTLDLTSGYWQVEVAEHGTGDPRKKKRGGKKGLAPDPPLLWTDDCERAFQTLKDRLMTAPVLGYPDYSLPFVLGGGARCRSGSGPEWYGEGHSLRKQRFESS